MIPTIHAARPCEPPAWARLQRRLLATMSEAAREASARYSLPDGTATFVDDVDDGYEARAGRGALYALGGHDDLRRIARREWEATTRLFDDAGPGRGHPRYVAQLTDEYYNLARPFEWFHQGEGNQSLYELALSEPDSAAFRERAARFADLMTGERNYDAGHRVFRSPFPFERRPPDERPGPSSTSRGPTSPPATAAIRPAPPCAPPSTPSCGTWRRTGTRSRSAAAASSTSSTASSWAATCPPT